jgi:hypothetical protein
MQDWQMFKTVAYSVLLIALSLSPANSEEGVSSITGSNPLIRDTVDDKHQNGLVRRLCPVIADERHCERIKFSALFLRIEDDTAVYSNNLF